MGHNLLIKIILIIIAISCVIYLFSLYQYNEKQQITLKIPEDELALFNNNTITNNCLDGVDIIYWINLDRSKDRYKLMQQMFADNAFDNIPIERVSATDGNYSNKVYSKLNLIQRQKNDYEYACLVSHLETVNKFSQTNYKYAIIMEDDVTLEYKKYWKQSIQQLIDNAPADWEIIQLCYILNNAKHQNPQNMKLYNYNKNNSCVSAAAYLISNTAAKKLMRKIYSDFKYHINPTVNHHADCYLFNMCKTYTYKYPYFIYTSADSLLHPEDLPGHILSKQKVTNMYETNMPNV